MTRFSTRVAKTVEFKEIRMWICTSIGDDVLKSSEAEAQAGAVFLVEASTE